MVRHQPLRIRVPASVLGGVGGRLSLSLPRECQLPPVGPPSPCSVELTPVGLSPGGRSWARVNLAGPSHAWNRPRLVRLLRLLWRELEVTTGSYPEGSVGAASS